MGIPRDSLKLAQSALKGKPAERSCSPAVVKCTARVAIYKKHKGLFKAAEKEIKREGRHLGELLFKKKLHLLSEKDIGKILKKVIKGRIKNEFVWDDLRRVIFCCNVGCVRGGDPLEEPAEGRPMGSLEESAEGRPMGSLNQTSTSSSPLTMDDEKGGPTTPHNRPTTPHNRPTTPHNRHIDHVNAYLLSIAVQKLNIRSAALLSFLFAYLRDSHRSMEPRQFLQIFLVLVKHTFRDVSAVHWGASSPGGGKVGVEVPPLGGGNQAAHTLNTSRMSSSSPTSSPSPTSREHLFPCGERPPPQWEQITRAEKNLLHVLTLHCAESINLFTLNDVAMTCEALCFFTLRDNPFIPFWNGFLSHVFGVSSAGGEVQNASAQGGDSLLKRSRRSPYVGRVVQRRVPHIGEAKNRTNGRREEIPEWHFELSGRNLLSIVKYTCLYGDLHPEVLNPLAKKMKKIFFEVPLDTTLHECVEILSLFNGTNELEGKTEELRERIHLYEHQFEGTLLVTQHDVKCLVTLARLSFERLNVIPFLKVFLNNVHKFSGEDAARLVRLLLASWGAHTGGGEDFLGGEDRVGAGRNHLLEPPPYAATLMRGLLSALLPACPEVISQLTYVEMLLLCGAVETLALPNRNILKRVAERISDDLKRVNVPSGHLPPAVVNYLFLITFALHRYGSYVGADLTRRLVKITLEREKERKQEKKLWQHQRRDHYPFYLLTLHGGSAGGSASMWVEYFNSLWGSLSPYGLDEQTMYLLLLLYFGATKRGGYRSLLRPVKRSAARCARLEALVVVSPYDRRFIYSEKQIKEELLKLFLHLWAAYPIRSCRKSLDLLIVVSAFREEAYLRSYLFSEHVVSRLNRYVALLAVRESSLSVHLCEDPVTKEPVRVNLSKLRYACQRVVRKGGGEEASDKAEASDETQKLLAAKAQKLLTAKQSRACQLEEATRSYLLNDYKHKELVAERGDAPQKGRPAKYLRNCRRGEPVLGALSVYGHQ
ncbi:conserved Plasmodium protein, unknown function [Plasmodium vivax]|uniref:Uncharacterized protein n=1 Tax=Plasmodium vivax TaxID=5855 RepID=A0A1G4GS07_PLAVI|nr:conserved Plasmodium protein, unknown function [Plasmodium vivax]